MKTKHELRFPMYSVVVLFLIPDTEVKPAVTGEIDSSGDVLCDSCELFLPCQSHLNGQWSDFLLLFPSPLSCDPLLH